MSRRRRGSQDEQPEKQPLELAKFRGKINTWLHDLYADIDPKTGYVVPYPKGFYGQKVKALTQQVYKLSPQVKLILGTRNIRATSIWIYLLHIFQFLSDYVIPPLLAFFAAYTYYFAEVPAYTVQYSPVNATNATNSSSWNIDPVAAGTWMGGSIRTLLSVPLQFITTTVDRTFHVSEAATSVHTTGSRLFYTPFVGIGVYVITHLVLKCILNMHRLLSKQWTLWNYQDLFLKETEQAIERAITDTMKPYLIHAFEQYLINSSESDSLVVQDRNTLLHIYQTFRDDIDLLRESIFEQVMITLRTKTFSELLVQGRINKEYMKGIHMLIRYADEELSSIMFQLNQDIHRIPSHIQQQLVNTGTTALNTIQYAAGRLMYH
jgi:hypothetical protein